MANKITAVFDLDSKGFDAGIKSLRTNIAEAEGGLNKAKTAASGLWDTMKANAGAVAIGAGAALVAFGVKAVNVFTDTAKAAVDGAAATGLNVEAMSRWIGVGDDFQVSAEQLVTGIGKIGKTLDSGKWEKYGIATRDAAGNARDANDILLDALSTLSSTTNETERARMGNDLFGKGYANLAPLIGHTRTEYEHMLGAVEKGQVITEAEAKKAEKTRLAMDNLHDAVQELSLSFGQTLAPALADTADGIAEVVARAQALAGAINDIPGIGGTSEHTLTDALLGKGGLPAELGLIKDAAEAVGDRFGIVADEAAGAGEAFDLVSDSSDRNKGALALSRAEQTKLNAEVDKGNSVFSVYAGNVKGAEDATAKKADEDKKAADAAKKHRDAVDALTDAMERQRDAALDLVGGDIAVRNAQRDAKKAASDLNDVLDDQTTTLDQAGAAIDDAADKQLNAASAAADYRAQQMEANGETVNAQTKAQLFKEELGKLAWSLQNGPLKDAILGYIDQLGAIPQTVTTTIVLNKPGRVGDINPFQRTSGARASGGPVSAGGFYEVNENGTELLREGGKTYLMAGGAGTVVPLSATPMAASPGAVGSGGITIDYRPTVSVSPFANPMQISRQLFQHFETYLRNGGVLPPSMR